MHCDKNWARITASVRFEVRVGTTGKRGGFSIMASNYSTLAAGLAQAIRRVADTAANEEELRIGVEKLLEPALFEF